jgi:hypothetical protein
MIRDDNGIDWPEPREDPPEEPAEPWARLADLERDTEEFFGE